LPLPNRTIWCLNLESGPPSFAMKFNYVVLWRHRIAQTDDSMSWVQEGAGRMQSVGRDQGQKPTLCVSRSRVRSASSDKRCFCSHTAYYDNRMPSAVTTCQNIFQPTFSRFSLT
jgi:hypothetical protein